MGLLRRLGSLYATYRRTMWLTGMLGTFAPTLLGYGMYALQTIKTRRGMVEDDPEHAELLQMQTPAEWVTHASGWLPIVARILTVVGIVALTLTVVAFIAKRTTITGRDETLKRMDAEAQDIEDDGDDEDVLDDETNDSNPSRPLI